MIVVLLLSVLITVSSISVERIIQEEPPFLDDTSDELFFNNDLEYDVCLTDTCYQEASRVLEYMDTSVDPCTDFYQFACGGFIEKYSYLNYTMNTHKLIDEERTQQMKDMFNDTDTPQWFRVIQDIHESCMNIEPRLEGSISTTMEMLDEFGGWPIVEGDSWDPEGFDIFGLAPGSQKYTGFYLLTANLYRHWNLSREDESVIKLMIVDSIILIASVGDNPSGFEDERVQKYYNNLLDRVTFLKEESSESVEEEAKQVTLLEIKLKQMLASCDYDSHAEITIKELTERIPSVPWLEYIKSQVTKSFEVGLDTKLSVPNLACLPELVDIIMNAPKREIANFVGSQISELLLSFMNINGYPVPTYMEEWRSFRDMKTRSTFCLEFLWELFSTELILYYIMKHFDEASTKKLRDVLLYVNENAQYMMQENDWLTEEVRNLVAENFKNENVKTDFPQVIPLATERAEEFTSKLIVSPDDFFHNALNIFMVFHKERRHTGNSEFRVLRYLAKGYPSYIWVGGKTKNIVIPIPVQQSPFFNKDLPNYMNFGGLGTSYASVVTYEVILKIVNEYPIEDWDEQSVARVQDTIDCLIQQLNLTDDSYYDERRIISMTVEAEEVYGAYEQWVEDNGEEPRLPFVDLTPKQLLWISGTHMTCESTSPEDRGSWYIKPGSWVNLVVSNSEAFSNDFNCPSTAAMNREEKCHLL